MIRKNSFFQILIVLFCLLFISDLAWGSFSKTDYKHISFTLQGKKSSSEDIEISARNVKIKGRNNAKKIKIKADIVTISAGTKLEIESLEVQCKKIFIHSSHIFSSGFISIHTNDLRSNATNWSSPVVFLKVLDSFTLDLKSQIEATYIGLDFSTNGFSTHNIQGKVLKKESTDILTDAAKQRALAFCNPSQVESCLKIITDSGNGQVKIGAKIEGFSSVVTQGKSNQFSFDFSRYSQIKDVDQCNLIGKNISLSGLIHCKHLKLDGVYHLWMSGSNKIECSTLQLLGGDVELNGQISSEQTSIQFTKNLILNKFQLQGGEARIFGNSKLNIKHLSVLDLTHFLQINALRKLTLSGETLSKIIEISSPRDIKASGINSAKSLHIDSGGKLDISGKVKIGEDGQLNILADKANLSYLEVQGANQSGRTADSFSLDVKKDTSISNTRVSGFKKGYLNSGKSLSTDKNTYIAIDDLEVHSPEMSLDGEFRCKKITLKGNKISYNGRIIDAKNVEFMGDDSINIGSTAVLHVLHSLKLKSSQQVTISGEVVSQVLEIAAPELLLLRNGNLTVKEKVAIYTSLWMKLAGTIDFTQAEATLAASGKLDLEGILKFRNLEIRKAHASEPQYSPGQKLVLKLKSRTRLEHVKEIVNLWAKQNPETDRNDPQSNPEQLLDDENFSEFIKEELS